MPPKKSSRDALKFVEDDNLEGLSEYFVGLSRDDAFAMCCEEVPRKGTMLHRAAKLGHLSILKYLVESLALNVNLKLTEGHVISGQSSLHEACLAGHDDVVEYLISKGGDVNAQDQDGQSPLHCATQGTNMRVVKLLLENGASIDLPDGRGQTPLQMSILRSPTDIITELVDRGADVNVADSDGQTPLHYAVEWENEDLVEILLEHGVNVNAQDAEGHSPVHLCVATGNTDILELLLDNGGDANLRDNRGKPPIEKPLDMDKEEFQAINNALSQHMEKMDISGPKYCEAASQIQERFSKLTVSGDTQVKAAKSDVMNELLVKTKRKWDPGEEEEVERKLPCRLLDELKSKSSKHDSRP